MTLAAINPSDGQRVFKGQVGLGVRCAFSFFYPRYIGENDLFAQFIARYLRKDSLVLDAGCGSGAVFRYGWRHYVRFVVGCDISDLLVRQNINISAGVSASLTHLPFAHGSFEVIFSRYVLEHLDDPSTVFLELARILKPGGKLIVLTPSKYHYVALLSRVTPHWVHEIVSTVRGNLTQDTFRTKYRANSKAELVRYAEKAGLRLKEFITREVCPNYLLWSLPSMLLGVAYERVVNHFETLSPFRVSIIGIFER